MNMLRMTLATVVTVFLCNGASAADNKKAIVGKWEVTKADPGTLPVGSTVDFAADGKFKMVFKADKELIADGTYTVDADSFTFKLKLGDEESSTKINIKKLDETVLETTNKDNKVVNLKRVK